MIAKIGAHKAANEAFGPALWVKAFAHHVGHNVNIDDLVKGNPVVPDDAEIETEFEVFRAGDKPGNGKKHVDLMLDPADAALVVRYEFYKYLGESRPDVEALCGTGGGAGGGGPTPEDCGGSTHLSERKLPGSMQCRFRCPNPTPTQWCLLTLEPSERQCNCAGAERTWEMRAFLRRHRKLIFRSIQAPRMSDPLQK